VRGDRLTGLYPYAASDESGQCYDARQFPKSSGYPRMRPPASRRRPWLRLAQGQVTPERPVIVRQRAMGALRGSRFVSVRKQDR
jgi:hypothetical protein